MIRIVLCVVLVSLSIFTVNHAAEDVLKFDSPEQRKMFVNLTHELRCLKCQNQTLASSGAALAGDLRREIHAMVQAGKSRSEIKEFLVQRYGDFVLYRPRFTAATFLLWTGPVIMLFLAFILVRSLRRKNMEGRVKIDGSELQKARSLLND